jgi:hypothetical protein
MKIWNYFRECKVMGSKRKGNLKIMQNFRIIY